MPKPQPPTQAGGNTDPPALPFAEVERELHAIATALMVGERRHHTLQPTALLHEAWLRLAGRQAPWADRTAFVRAAAGTMRRVLVDHGRARARDKRGGEWLRVTIAPDLAAAGAPPEDVVAIDAALAQLQAVDPELARIVELRVFGGLDHGEIAATLGTSLRTVERGWRLARAFLARALGDGHDA